MRFSGKVKRVIVCKIIYCIVGDRNPIAKAYELVKRENGLLVSVKKETK